MSRSTWMCESDLVQEKATKEKDTPDGALILRIRGFETRAPSTQRSVARVRRGHPARAPFGALTQSLAVLGHAIRGLKVKAYAC